jgi:hypothetical protein
MTTFQMASVEPFPLDPGDEIRITGQYWIVDSVYLHYGSGRGGDSVESVTLDLVTVATNEQGGRMANKIRIYPRWYISDKAQMPHFDYTMIQRQAWGKVWVKRS